MYNLISIDITYSLHIHHILTLCNLCASIPHMTKKIYTSNRDRFVEVAQMRTQAVIDRLRVLGHCSNKSLYDYRPEEINKIFRTIQYQLNETKERFAEKKNKKFKL